jgi:hypothetical protein
MAQSVTKEMEITQFPLNTCKLYQSEELHIPKVSFLAEPFTLLPQGCPYLFFHLFGRLSNPLHLSCSQQNLSLYQPMQFTLTYVLNLYASIKYVDGEVCRSLQK